MSAREGGNHNRDPLYFSHHSVSSVATLPPYLKSILNHGNMKQPNITVAETETLPDPHGGEIHRRVHQWKNKITEYDLVFGLKCILSP